MATFVHFVHRSKSTMATMTQTRSSELRPALPPEGRDKSCIHHSAVWMEVTQGVGMKLQCVLGTLPELYYYQMFFFSFFFLIDAPS